MKYTDQKQKITYEDIEIEVPEGTSYFKTLDEDGENEFYYKLNIKPDPRFSRLYNIAITKMLNYDDNYFVRWFEICEAELPYSLRDYFRGEESSKKQDITEEEFNMVKQEILDKLNGK